MLTLKAPIELKNRTGFIHDYSSFYERMTGNYSMIGSQFAPGEMLHLLSMPPEIYIADGGMTTVSGNTVINSKNEEKINIINNVMNRIMLSMEGNLTYQDRAYITDVLNTIGIKDDKRFMSEVNKIMDETRQTYELINAYFTSEYAQSEAVLIESVRETLESRIERTREERLREEGEYLGSVIMDRLQTGAIYQIVSNFNRSVTDGRIDNREYTLSEQNYTAQQIFLSRIRENTIENVLPLIFKSEAEAEEERQPEYTVQQSPDRFVTETSQDNRTYNEENLTELAREFVTREINERERLERERSTEREERIRTERTSGRENISKETKTETTRERREIKIKSPDTATKRVLKYLSEREETLEKIPGQTLIYRQEILPGEVSANEEGAEVNVDNRQTNVNIENREYREAAEAPQRGRRVISDEAAKEVQIRAGQIIYQSSNTYEKDVFSQKTEGTSTTENITSAVFLDMIRNLVHTGYQKSYASEDIWQDMRSFLYRSSENTLTRLSFASSDIYLRTVEMLPEREEITAQISLPEALEEVEEEAVRQENIEMQEFIKELQQIDAYNQSNVEKYRQMLTILGRVREERGRRDGAEQTRKASLAALGDADALNEILKEEEEADNEIRNEAFKEIQRLFPDDSARIFNIMEQYLSNPQNLSENVSIVSNNMTGLIEDIERVNRTETERQQLILRERQEQADEAEQEIEKLTQRSQEAAGSVPERQRQEAPLVEIVLRQNEGISTEELAETIESIQRSNVTRNRVNESDTVLTEEKRSNVRQVINETGSLITENDREDIERMVSRGVREQMGAISDQVMHKLERKLRDEKSRRGI